MEWTTCGAPWTTERLEAITLPGAPDAPYIIDGGSGYFICRRFGKGHGNISHVLAKQYGGGGSGPWPWLTTKEVDLAPSAQVAFSFHVLCCLLGSL